MELIIEKSAYFDVEKISFLKTKACRIIKNDDIKTGIIEINLSYQNISGEECFKTCNIEYSIDLDKYNIIDIKLNSNY